METTRRGLRLVAAAAILTLSGCIGGVRETTTARTATEMLLVSTAAERAVEEYDASHLSDAEVKLDTSRFESVDKSYVVSAVRERLARAGAILVDELSPGDGDEDAAPRQVVIELRNAALAIYENEFTLGIPELPVSAQGFPPVMLPPAYIFRRTSQQGWAKLQLWTYDPTTKRYIDQSPDLWGKAYHNLWWLFGIGPIPGSQDVYPDWDMPEYVSGTAEKVPAEE